MKSILLLAIALIMTFKAVLADTEAGIIYYESHKYNDAFVEFESSSQGGSEKAQNYLARMYARGEGTLMDNIKAIEWLNQSAVLGFSKSQYEMAKYYTQCSNKTVSSILSSNKQRLFDRIEGVVNKIKELDKYRNFSIAEIEIYNKLDRYSSMMHIADDFSYAYKNAGGNLDLPIYTSGESFNDNWGWFIDDDSLTRGFLRKIKDNPKEVSSTLVDTLTKGIASISKNPIEASNPAEIHWDPDILRLERDIERIWNNRILSLSKSEKALCNKDKNSYARFWTYKAYNNSDSSYRVKAKRLWDKHSLQRHQGESRDMTIQNPQTSTFDPIKSWFR